MLSLNKIAGELGTTISQEQNLAIIMSPSAESFIQAYSELVDWLYSFMLDKASKAANSAQEIIDFIHSNFCNYDMSLNLLKEKFGYNIHQYSSVSHFTKTFRTYFGDKPSQFR